MQSSNGTENCSVSESAEASDQSFIDPYPEGQGPGGGRLKSLSKRNLREVEDIYSLSSMQEGMLFRTLTSPAQGLYFEQAVWRLRGELRPAALKESWRLLTQRHSVLRSAFHWEGLSHPVQVVFRRPELNWRDHDWSAYSSRQQSERLQELLGRDRRSGFNPARAPLMRVALIDCGRGLWQMIWSFHHLLLDAWSAQLLVEELYSCYEQLDRGSKPRFPNRPAFRDYIAWLRSRDQDEAEQFWREQLKGCPSDAGLLGRIERSSGDGDIGTGRMRIRLERESTNALVQFCKARDLTLNTVAMGAWALTLARVNGMREVVFGAVASGRPPDLEASDHMIGLFANTIPIRVAVNGRESLVPWLKALQAGFSQLRRFEHVRPADIRCWTSIPSGQALFESLLAFQNTPRLRRGGCMGEASIEDVSYEPPPSELPLTVMIEPRERLLIRFLFDCSRLSQKACEALMTQMIHLMESFVCDPSLQPRGLLSDDSQCGSSPARANSDCEGGDTDLRPPEVIHRLFERQAARRPGATALEVGNLRLTYSQLNRRADLLAGRLGRLGAGPETVVAVCLRRGWRAVETFLAVLKSGAAYLPLDPAYPRRRLEFLIKDSGAAILVSENESSALAESADADVLVLDDQEEAKAEERGRPASIAVGPDSIAYVIYTSGSSGRPKGVAVSHRAVVSLSAAPGHLSIRRSDRVAQQCSLSFDPSALEIWGALINGACLCVTGVGGDFEAGAFRNELQEAAISVSVLSTAHFQLAARHSPDCFSRHRLVVVGGDRLDPTLARSVLLSGGPRRLVNAYGPTECTVVSTAFALPREFGPSDEVPIGRPLAGKMVHVLDGDLREVRGRSVGELCISGAGLARGYWGRPGLTALRIRPNPFGPPGSRIYLSGDLVRRHEDGDLRFRGRLDRQLKVRGHRIEPAELEHALERHPAVSEAAVKAFPDPCGGCRLAAYVVLHPDPSVRPENWREAIGQHLSGLLPEFMIPAAISEIKTMPLLPSGKRDEDSLAWPDSAPCRRELPEHGLSPVEARLIRLWEEALQVDGLGRDADFFRCGGHSLLAGRVVARLRQSFKVEIRLRDLFEAPTPAAMQTRIEAARCKRLPGIEVVDRSRPLPLSFAQQRLWLLDQLHPGDRGYRIAAAWTLKGTLDVRALEGSLDAIVGRHEALRTCFPASFGKPRQRILSHWTPGLPLVDLSRLPDRRRRSEARRLQELESERPFDLAQAPPLRTLLILEEVQSAAAAAQGSFLFLITLHHIAADGQSMGLLARELEVLYSRLSRSTAEPGDIDLVEKDSVLPDLPVQYADFAVWQRDLLRGEALQELMEFWKRRLASASPLRLPWGGGVGSEGRREGLIQPLRIRPGSLSRLQALGRSGGATLFMTLTAAFQTFLHRIVAQEDILVGIPMANRTSSQVEKLIGFFVNILPIRGDCSGDPSFLEFLGQIADRALDAYEHQELPLERLIERLQPERDVQGRSLLRAVISMQEEGASRLRLQGMSVESAAVDSASARFDLELHLRPQKQGLAGMLHCRGQVLTASALERLCRRLETLFDGISSDPRCRLSQLPFLSESERREALIGAGGPSERPAPEAVTVRLRRWALRTPDAPAVLWGADCLSYSQLDAASKRLALRLADGGIESESIVAICISDPGKMVAAMLAVLKSGCAYLPLDPALPRERLVCLIQRTRPCRLLVSSSDHPLIGLEDLSILDVETDRLEADTQEPGGPHAVLETGQLADSLAYVVCTSGSTGLPKPVAVTHRGLSHLIEWHQRAYQPGPGDRLAQTAAVGFDAAVWEIWSCLASGATLCVAPPEARRSQKAIRDWLIEQRIDSCFLSTPLAEAVLQEDWPEEAALRSMLTGGDRLHRSALTGLRVPLFNHYGPTECSVVATAGRVHREESEPAIGRPLDHVELLILDRHLQLVPPGLPGHLHLGGPALARGYLDSPSLTASRFIPNPCSVRPGQRLYASGDLARLRDDGQVEFLGRIDDQVQIRGMRVEPAEVEALAMTHPGVKQAVVAARPGPRGWLRLEGYAVAEGDPEEDALRRELRELMALRLPLEMRPNSWTVLDSLPLTPHGKVDRRALPCTRQAGGDSPSHFEDEREQHLARIWQELLRVVAVSREDDFFELGGHSLLASSMIAQIQESFGVELPLRAVFESPRLCDLAQVLPSVPDSARSSLAAASAIRPVDRSGLLPLSFAQQRLWFLDQLASDESGYHIAAAWKVEGPLDRQALGLGLAAILRRHEILRTSIVERDGEPRQRIESTLVFSLPLIDLEALPRARRDREAYRLSLCQAARPFDLSTGSSLRASLMNIGPNSSGPVHRFSITLHHLCADGWSMSVLLRELNALYGCYSASSDGSQPPAAGLPELPLQYGDYALWQRQRLSGQRLEGLLAFWKEHLTGLSDLELPFDGPVAAGHPVRQGVSRLSISAQLKDRLEELARRHGTTLYTVLLTAFHVLLRRLSGSLGFALGSPIAGRVRPEVRSSIGNFSNTLPIRFGLAGDPTFVRALEEAHATCLQVLEHQELPFEVMVEHLKPQRSAQENPLFRVAFALQNLPREELDLQGLRTEQLAVLAGKARFDLELHLRPCDRAVDGFLAFDRRLIAESTASRWGRHFLTLITGVLTDPQRNLSRLPLLCDEERAQLLSEWNGRTLPPPRRCVHERIEAHARLHPHAEAVSFLPEGATEAEEECRESLSWMQLVRDADRLAHRLIRRGIGPESVVAVCLPPSPAMVVAQLAALKAGASYLPMDASHPAQRLEFMMRDCNASLLVTVTPLSAKLGGIESLEVLQLDRESEDLSGLESHNPKVEAPMRHRAYVVYTSGSTGRPKGVEVEHFALANLVEWHGRTYSLGRGDRAAQTASAAFDAAAWEIWGALGAGATLCIAPEEARRDPRRMIRWLERERIDLCFLPTPMAQAALSEPWPRDLPLRALLTGGDRLHQGATEGFARPLFNHYGPTECSVVSTAARVQRDEPGLPPIGRPIDNLQACVLDADLQPLPIGVAGQLYLAGAGLARGYMGRPAETAIRFIPNPWAGLEKDCPLPAPEGDRLYRTGDRARWRKDGQLEFLGRIDSQVQVNGVRLELGEVESLLMGHPQIAQAAALVKEGLLAAYVVRSPQLAAKPWEQLEEELGSLLRQRLPAQIRTFRFVPLERMPLSSNGKVDRDALGSIQASAAEPAPGRPAVGGSASTEQERIIEGIWRELLGIDQVDRSKSFFESGGHSLLLVKLRRRLEGRFRRNIEIADLFANPSLPAMAQLMTNEPKALTQESERILAESSDPPSQGQGRPSDERIAVVGLACRFPGARDEIEFWRNLQDGAWSISFWRKDAQSEDGIDPKLLENPDYVPARGLLENPDLFDAGFFGFTPREAEVLDPQHRLFLECCWESLENSGCDPDRFSGRIGIFASASRSGYLERISSGGQAVESAGGLQLLLANDPAFLASQAAYRIGLTGPCMSVNTACSSSLTAVHLACQALRDGQCEAALAGGVSLQLPLKQGHIFQQGGVLSPDGCCRSFDRRAEGTVRGDGVGVVLLKRLSDAVAQGDRIRALILGTAVSNDGRRRQGFAAPARDGQADAIVEAHRRARVSAQSITYVEAHGSATPLGDPVEVAALTQAFRQSTSRTAYCALGSVKSNIGHLDAAAGVAGLIKTVLSLENARLPASLHFSRPNPEIDFDSSPFFVNRELRDWPSPSDGAPRRAGVSSLGIGGTNVHLVLEEAPPPAPAHPSRDNQLLVVSAHTSDALKAAVESLGAHLHQNSDLALADAACTLSTGRRFRRHRAALVCSSTAEAADQLSRGDEKLMSALAEDEDRPVAFLFPGQGTLYSRLGSDLYRSETEFARWLDRCAELLRPILKTDIRQALWDADGRRSEPDSEIRNDGMQQSLLFALEFSLARLWLSWGVRPRAMIGHSLGEFAAACLAGVLSLPDALEVVAERARLMEQLPAGAMLAVPRSETALGLYLQRWGKGPGRDHPQVFLSSVIGPELCLVSGSSDAVGRFRKWLGGQGVQCLPVPTGFAGHSRLLAPIASRLADRVAQAQLGPPCIPFLSGVTGDWIRDEEATDPEYWARHLCEPARFAPGLKRLLEDPRMVLLEVGPGNSLSSIALQHPLRSAQQAVFCTLPGPRRLGPLRSPRPPEDESVALLRTLGRLWTVGVKVDWETFWKRERRQRLALPTYPFQRQRYWIEDEPISRSGPQQDRQQCPGTAGSDPKSVPEVEPSETPKKGTERKPGDRPDQTPATAGEDTILPRLIRICASVLGQEGIQSDDDFFEWGGHSLSALQVLSRVRSEFGVELTPEAFFENSGINQLAARIADSAGRPQGAHSCSITPADRCAELPLSYYQQRLWFIDQLLPGHPAYNMPTGWYFEGRLNPAALKRSIEAIVARHESLRTRFESRRGRPIQRIDPHSSIRLPVIDLRALDPDRRQAELERINRREAELPFNLAQGPLLRFTLALLGEERSAALLNVHHIALDRWSLVVFLRELAWFHQRFAEGLSADADGSDSTSLSPLPIQYPDYAVWQREQLQGERLERLLEYWEGCLKGIEPLQLIADHQRPALQRLRAGCLEIDFPGPLCDRLQALSRERGATLFMILLAAFHLLMSRWSGQSDIVVGAPIANRSHPELEDLIGLFIDLLAMRADLSGDPSFLVLLDQVAAGALEAYSHQDLPFEMLVDRLAPRRDPSRNPIFQVTFALLNDPAPETWASSLRIEGMPFRARNTRFDLEFHLWESRSALKGIILYDSDLFQPASIQSMRDHFGSILEGIAQGPDRRLSQLGCIGTAARQQLLDWSLGQPLEESPTAAVHEAFRRQALRSPGAAAVRWSGQADEGRSELSITYAQLENLAARIARGLMDLGVHPGDRVIVALHPSPLAIAAFLGVLKAGACYLPLDPEYPQERKRRLIDDSLPSAIVTQPGDADHQAIADIPALFPQPAWGRPDEALSEMGSSAGVCGESLACILYTSGSTGKPKGAAVPHRAILGVTVRSDYLRIRPSDRVAQASSLCFDASTFEIWGALLNGACLALLDRQELLSPKTLATRLEQEEVTVLFLTTALFHQTVREAPEAFKNLRCLLTGGEAMDPHAMRSLLQQGAPARLLHVYGPTESTVFATWQELKELSQTAASVPIGRPLARREAWVLDGDLRPCPLGAPGELYLGGDGLARGYWRQPGLTAEVFVPHGLIESDAQPPWGARLYRSGDLARWNARGELEFLRRVDDQLKIRGFRIEPGEIEAVLRSHPCVQNAAAAAREFSPGDRRLIAYVVLEPDRPDDAAAGWERILRAFLKESLPSYLLPSVFVFLEELPINASGKIDRPALPLPSSGEAGKSRGEAPKDATQALLLDILRQVLQNQRVGIEDNFFESGGDSILAIQVAARACEAGLDLSVRDLFVHQSVGDLCAKLTAAAKPNPPSIDWRSSGLSPEQAEELPIPLDRIEDVYPMTPLQEGMLFHSRSRPQRSEYVEQLSLRLSGRLKEQSLRRAWRRAVDSNPVLRSAFVWEEGMTQALQVVLTSADPEWRSQDWRQLGDSEAEHLLQTLGDLERRRGFQLDCAPLIRLHLVRFRDDVHWLLWTFHHLLLDGWSLGLLLHDVLRHYEALEEGSDPPTSPRRPFRDYVDWLQRQEPGAAEAHWRAELQGALPQTLGRAGSSTPAHVGHGEAQVRLSDELTQRLTQVSRKHRITVGTWLQGAWGLVLHRLTSDPDAVFGLAVSGRPPQLQGVESMIGMFLNTLPVRLMFDLESSLLDWLQRIQSKQVEMRRYEHTPLQKVLEWSGIPRDQPLFESVLAFENLSASAVPDRFAGLQLTSVRLRERSSYPLALSIHPGPEMLLRMGYDRDRFEAGEVESMLILMVSLIECMTQEPERRLGGILEFCSANGEESRNQLPEAWSIRRRDEIERQLTGIWEEILGVKEPGVEENFFDLGGHSLLMLRLQKRLREELEAEVSITDLFRYSRIRSLAEHLVQQVGEGDISRQASAVPLSQRSSGSPALASATAGAEPIAVVGMAGRFPGADCLRSFWRNLAAGIESITTFSDEEMREAGVSEAQLRDPRHIPAAGVIDGIERFDAAFFGISPREAERIDPQQRMALECAWHALEDAGYDPGRFLERIGVFAGSSANFYLLRQLLSDPESVATTQGFQMALGTQPDHLTSRISYKLNLRGPSINVQTACSSSLAAIHLACRSLLDGQCEMALAGGASAVIPQKSGYHWDPGSPLSRDGRCRPFQSQASGTLRGSGVAMVVLKRLSQARRDRDSIHALILGTGISNDGGQKPGYTAPGVEGQAQAISAALQTAGVEADSLSYIEAHGTGTALGDPIEFEALRQVFEQSGARRGYCALSALKSNIGHLDAAAGAAGLIKVILSLRHRAVPPIAGFGDAHPEIPFDSSPFYPATGLIPWKRGTSPRRAGVSSFGMGGTNVHAVVQEAPPQPATSEQREWKLVVLSARTHTALEASTTRLARDLGRSLEEEEARSGGDSKGISPALADIAFTLQVGRRAMVRRRAVLCRNRADAAEALRSALPDRIINGEGDAHERKAAFLLPGQGNLGPGMGCELYSCEPAFRREFDRCSKILRPFLKEDLRDILGYRQTPPDGGRISSDNSIVQPALFALEYALARMWIAWGVHPQALLGHSLGELAAACLSGVFSLEDALRLAAVRGKLVQQAPPGGMISVALSAREAIESVFSDLTESIELAAENLPGVCTLSGPTQAIAQVEERLQARGLHYRRLPVNRAFHSRWLGEAAERFRSELKSVERRSPEIPLVSSLSGDWADPEQVRSCDYWVRQLLQPVRFSSALQRLCQDSHHLLLEVGPGRTLTSIAQRHPDCGSRRVVASSLTEGPERSEQAQVLEALGRLWVAGVEIDWRAFHFNRRRRVSLPGYPFERRRYWIQEGPTRSRAASEPTDSGGDDPEWGAFKEARVRIAEVWKEVLGTASVDAESDFFELGGDSLSASQAAARLSREFGSDLAPSQIAEHSSVAGLARFLSAGVEVSRAKSGLLIALSSEGSRPPLFCPHPIGGDVMCYRELARRVGGERPIYGIRAVGWNRRETPLTDVAGIAARQITALRRLQPQGPYFVCGHSFGGVIAYEIARQLIEGGQRIGFLGIIDTPLPAPGQGVTVEGGLRGIHCRSEPGRGQEADISAAIVAAHAQALNSYRPRPCPVQAHVFRAQESPDCLGQWRELALDGVTQCTLSGDHFSILRMPLVESLAENLRHLLQPGLKEEELAAAPL